LVKFQRIVPPGLRAVAAADVEADAEAAPGPAQHDDAGAGVGVRLLEHALDPEPHVHRERVELVGPVEGDDADLAVGLVADDVRIRSLARVAHSSTSLTLRVISGGAA